MVAESGVSAETNVKQLSLDLNLRPQEHEASTLLLKQSPETLLEGFGLDVVDRQEGLGI